MLATTRGVLLRVGPEKRSWEKARSKTLAGVRHDQDSCPTSVAYDGGMDMSCAASLLLLLVPSTPTVCDKCHYNKYH